LTLGVRHIGDARCGLPPSAVVNRRAGRAGCRDVPGGGTAARVDRTRAGGWARATPKV